MKDTLARTQLAANADKVGGWDNAMKAADAIESGNHSILKDVVSDYPSSHPLVERIVEASSKYR